MNNLTLPSFTDKPFVYSSFVSTIDGKIFVHEPGYWPIGSSEDYKRFTYLRAHADIIIDGKKTALEFADRTIETIHGEMFQLMRDTIGITKKIAYAVLTNNPSEDLLKKLENPFNFKSILITNKQVDSEYITTTQSKDTLKKTFEDLFSQGYKRVFIDGGPTLISSLIEEGLLDELFLTISPKILGSKEGITQTLAEGKLFPPDNISMWKIVSVEKVADEIFIRYAKK